MEVGLAYANMPYADRLPTLRRSEHISSGRHQPYTVPNARYQNPSLETNAFCIGQQSVSSFLPAFLQPTRNKTEHQYYPTGTMRGICLYGGQYLPFTRGLQSLDYPHSFDLPALQDLCDAPVRQGTNYANAPTFAGKQRVHPFYSRIRTEPAEGMTRTRDKYRVVYTEKQRKGLENEYEANKFLTAERKAEISKEFQLSERQVKIWFQNRRAKERRYSMKKKNAQQQSSPKSVDDNDKIDNSLSILDNTISRASCRFASGNSQCAESGDGSNVFQNINRHHTGYGVTDCTSSVMSSASRSCDSTIGTCSLSPREVNMTPTQNFIPPLNVSPISWNLEQRFCS